MMSINYFVSYLSGENAWYFDVLQNLSKVFLNCVVVVQRLIIATSFTQTDHHRLSRLATLTFPPCS
jgi:hypothetical protein